MPTTLLLPLLLFLLPALLPMRLPLISRSTLLSLLRWSLRTINKEGEEGGEGCWEGGVVEEAEEEEGTMTGTLHHLPRITPRMHRQGITPLRVRIISGGDRGGMIGIERDESQGDEGGERRRFECTGRRRAEKKKKKRG